MAIADQIIGVESGGDPFARNPRSSAGGAGQFIDSTWLSMISKYRPDIAQGKTKEQILQLKFDPALSKQMTDAYAQENASFLKQRGIEPTPGNTYLAHFAGPSGAAALHSDPGKTVEALLGSDAVRANPFLRGKRGADVIAWAEGKMNPGQRMAKVLRQRYGGEDGAQNGPVQGASGQDTLAGGSGMDRLKAALGGKSYDADKLKSAEGLIASGQSIAKNNDNWVGALGATALAGYGGYQRDQQAAGKQADEAKMVESLIGGGAIPPEIKALVESSNPEYRNAGIEAILKLRTAKPETGKWHMSRDGSVLVNDLTGETKPTGQGPAARLTEGQKAVDRKFGTDYAEFKTGGETEVQKRLDQLTTAKTRLESGDGGLTGPIVGNVPDWLNSLIGNEQAVSTRELVEEVAQSNLREVLGGQFAMKEGEQLIRRAYNPKLSEQENASRVGRLVTQIDGALKAKQAASAYYETNGTLKGYTGPKTPTLEEIEKIVEGTEQSSAPTADGGTVTAPKSSPITGARQAADGNWYVADPDRPGKYLKVEQ
jgi:hypothetical protein